MKVVKIEIGDTYQNHTKVLEHIKNKFISDYEVSWSFSISINDFQLIGFFVGSITPQINYRGVTFDSSFG